MVLSAMTPSRAWLRSTPRVVAPTWRQSTWAVTARRIDDAADGCEAPGVAISVSGHQTSRKATISGRSIQPERGDAGGVTRAAAAASCGLAAAAGLTRGRSSSMRPPGSSDVHPIKRLAITWSRHRPPSAGCHVGHRRWLSVSSSDSSRAQQPGTERQRAKERR